MVLQLLDLRGGKIIFSALVTSPIITYLVLSNYVHGIHATSLLTKFFPDYLIYYDHLPTTIQIVVGLIVVVSIFYLGKSHDYIKEYIKYQSKLYGLTAKLKRKYDENDNEKKKIYFKKLDDEISYFQRLSKNVSSSRMIVLGFFFMSLFLIGIPMITTFGESLSIQVKFIKLVLILGEGIAQFVVFWILYELVMSLHEESLRQISRKVEEYESLE